MFVFVIWFIPYSHKSSDFGVNPRFSVFNFGFFLCGMNLIMALSSSDVILSLSLFTGLEIRLVILSNSDTCMFL